MSVYSIEAVLVDVRGLKCVLYVLGDSSTKFRCAFEMSMLEDRSNYINVSESAQDTDYKSKTHKIQAGVQVSRLEDTDIIFIIGSTLEVFIMLYLYLIGTLDGENLDKMKEKGNACIFVGYSTQSRAYTVFNKRRRIIVETIHVNFDELTQMASDHVSSDPVPQCLTTALEHDSLSPGPQSQENVSQVAETVTMSNELDFLFSPMFDELLNGTTLVVSKSSAVNTADAPDKRQQQHTTSSFTTTVDADSPPLNIQTTPQTTNQAPTHVPTVNATENIIQAETNNEYAQVDDDEFLETDGEFCMFALTVSRTEPKNIKEAMADSAWIEAMQEELHQFD
ncbi:putative ribonuclease H-like domain-containing protein [Tanacetum coccineum]|uniref:Ribonuclease H-like domain-containing protein n=1 Tax=Tanacetum coccineum TaxID=301880 RepID=A0ABQ5G465_9ASTR